MPKSQPPLLSVLEGLFYTHPTRGLVVQTSEGEVFLQDLLLAGQEVSLSASYMPRSPPLIGVPGFGCCVIPSACEFHTKDPEFLYSSSGQGVLSQDSQGNLLLGGEVFPISTKMSGHYGRLVCCLKLPRQESSLEDLFGEVSGMAELLKALKSEIS